MERQRSPNYPSLSLPEAIDLVSKLHKAVRTNVVSRETAARDMGYAGLTGRSVTVIAALAQYGLIDRAGKGDIKVTRRAVEILHPLEPGHRAEAIREAANSPALFRDIRDRFTDGLPSANALRSYLIQRDFQDGAIGPAISSFLETNTFVEKEGEQVKFDVSPVSGEIEPSVQAKENVGASQTALPPEQVPAPVIAPTILNKINMNIQGDRVHVEAVLDYRGLLALERKIAGLKVLMQPDSDVVSDGHEDS